MVHVYIFGKQYEVPASLTIMEAMEYAGYQLIADAAAATASAVPAPPSTASRGDRELKACLACQTQVQNNMYVATLPFFPLVKSLRHRKRSSLLSRS